MKKFFALLLTALLLTGITAFAEVHKTELVYARLSASGELKGLYVVNAFEATEEAEQEDYGIYSELTQLSDSLALNAVDGKLSLKLPKGRSYYQGKPERQELPWDIRVHYKLDGNEVEPKALSGATGLLTIGLSVQVREGMEVYAQGCTLQVSLRLDGDRCLHVQAEHATIAQAGGDLVLSYMLLPGQSAAYELSAQVSNFAMEGLQVNGLRIAMDAEQYKKAMASGLEGNPMAQAIAPVIENFVRRLEGGAPKSFVDSRNGEIRGLQFILLSEGIEEPEKQGEPEAAKEEPQGFLARLAALFKGK